MKKNQQIIVWVIVLALVALGLWLLLGSGSQPVSAPTTATSTATTTQTPPAKSSGSASGGTRTGGGTSSGASTPVKIAGVGSFASLLGQRQELSCTISTAKISGSMYISDTKMRANFTMTSGGKTTSSSLIDDGRYLSLWTTGSKTGLRLSVAISSSGSAMASAGGIDPQAQLSYRCVAWTPDQSFFTPPADILFTDTNGNLVQ